MLKRRQLGTLVGGQDDEGDLEDIHRGVVAWNGADKLADEGASDLAPSGGPFAHQL